MNTSHVLKTVAIVWLSLNGCSSFATNVTQVNRYATVENKPLPAQINPLLTVQQIHFPQHVETVGDALTYWLQYSGFALAAEQSRSKALNDVMRQPLPQVDRHFGPLTVTDGLTVLVGQNVFMLTQDPLHRQVNFKLKPINIHPIQPAKGHNV